MVRAACRGVARARGERLVKRHGLPFRAAHCRPASSPELTLQRRDGVFVGRLLGVRFDMRSQLREEPIRGAREPRRRLELAPDC